MKHHMGDHHLNVTDEGDTHHRSSSTWDHRDDGGKSKNTGRHLQRSGHNASCVCRECAKDQEPEE